MPAWSRWDAENFKWIVDAVAEMAIDRDTATGCIGNRLGRFLICRTGVSGAAG